jgi:hypothetical protein
VVVGSPRGAAGSAGVKDAQATVFSGGTARKIDDSKLVCHDDIAQSPPLNAGHATQMIAFVNPRMVRIIQIKCFTLFNLD